MSLPGYVVIEAFPFNGQDDADAALLPVDITGFVNDNLQVPTSSYGRQTDLSTVDPGPFSVTLNNGTPPLALPAVTDTFGRTVSSGWGSADTGQAWTVGATASDFAVDAGIATQSLGSVNALRTSTVDIGTTDFDVTVDVALPVASAVGANVSQWVTARWSDSNNYYVARLDLTTGGLVTLVLLKRVGGVLSPALGTGVVTVGSGHAGGDWWRLRFVGIGGILAARAWLASGADPGAWQVLASDGDLSGGTQASLLSRLESGNSNTLPVVVSWRSFTARAPFSVSDVFTPGNQHSPLYPGWRTGMRLRMRETIGVRTFTLADGNLLQPAVTIQTPGSDQTVTVTAVDRIGRLQQGRRFLGTLAEYILYNGGTALKGYWPCNESVMPLVDASGNGNPPIRQGGIAGSSFAVTSGGAVSSPGRGSPVLSDDAATLYLQGGLGVDGSGNNVVAEIPDLRLPVNGTTAGANIPSGEFLTVVTWLNGDPPAAPVDLTTFALQVSTINAFVLISVDSIGRLTTDVSGTFTGNAGTGWFPVSGWMPLAVRFSWSAPSLEVWVGTNQYQVALTGTAASDHLSEIAMPEIQGSHGHVQVYIGASSAWGATQMAAQMDAARSCLAGQYTGQRVTTIMQYAGVPASELSAVDTGVAVMERATLAGKTALDAIREAEATEQGLLHAYGRQPVFHSRVRRYNR